MATNPDFNSLNLAAAVQVFTYELQLAFCDCAFDPAPGSSHEDAGTTTAADLEGLYTHMERGAYRYRFLRPKSTEVAHAPTAPLFRPRAARPHGTEYPARHTHGQPAGGGQIPGLGRFFQGQISNLSRDFPD